MLPDVQVNFRARSVDLNYPLDPEVSVKAPH